MKRNRRSDFKPWTHDLPVFVLRGIFVVMFIPFMLLAAWEGGMKEAWREFKVEWDIAGDPPPGREKKLP